MTVLHRNSTITKEAHRRLYAKLLDKFFAFELQPALDAETTMNTIVCKSSH